MTPARAPTADERPHLEAYLAHSNAAQGDFLSIRSVSRTSYTLAVARNQTRRQHCDNCVHL